ncbi:WD40 repeat-like protein [Exidia glandulosa HHB12029]|uniref:U three protein 7 n=1 Tax=Exidia glandulosa HHB12029 TaxID=1314781 RepID=A0A165ZRU4_EXIGL|nr:WD40 repeat-like protein [Exidia glandulosa HHB12029]
MDALVAKADALRPVSQKRPRSSSKRRKSTSDPSSSKNVDISEDKTAQSVLPHTRLPASLRAKGKEVDRTGRAYNHIGDKRLRAHLASQSLQNVRAKGLVDDLQDLLVPDEQENAGLRAEHELERTWRVTQDEIVKTVGGQAASGRREWKLDGGTYRSRYTRNGRHLAIVGKNGHVATFDWQSGTLHSEIQLRETCRDITFLQDHSMYAVAQSKHVYIYDQNGVELHRLASHVEPTRLEFLPYHWLLVSVGMPGYLKYQDTSTGQMLVEHRTKLGACHTMAQNPHNAVIHLGHQNGTVTLWTPNMPQPAVRLLAHMGPVSSLAVDPSHAGGRYMATSGADGRVKIWDCRNWKGCIREWSARGGPAELDFSARGHLGVASGGTVNVYGPQALFTPHTPPVQPPLYLTHPITTRPIASARFAPFTDSLLLGHAAGLSSILVPGSGEPQYDSREADPFEGRRARREREVRGLLDKVPADMITLDPEFVGAVAAEGTGVAEKEEEMGVAKSQRTPFARLPRAERLRAQGKADETEVQQSESSDDEEEDEGGDVDVDGKKEVLKKRKHKMRGRETALKKYLKKKRKNVVDPRTEALRAKLEAQRKARVLKEKKAAGAEEGKLSVLDRFRR